jgi:hypothetical protein
MHEPDPPPPEWDGIVLENFIGLCIWNLKGRQVGGKWDDAQKESRGYPLNTRSNTCLHTCQWMGMQISSLVWVWMWVTSCHFRDTLTRSDGPVLRVCLEPNLAQGLSKASVVW